MHTAIAFLGLILGAVAIFYTLVFLFIGAVWLWVNVAYAWKQLKKRFGVLE